MVYWERVTFSDLPLSIAISKAGNFRDPLNFGTGHVEILHTFSSYGNYSTIQSTSDNSNEKSWSYREFEANTQNDGEGFQVSCTFHGDGHWIWTGVTKKVKTKNWHLCFEINSVLRTSDHFRVQRYTVFFPLTYLTFRPHNNNFLKEKKNIFLLEINVILILIKRF